MDQTVQKKCAICNRLFTPNKKTMKRQHICDQLECKIEYKRRYNEQWRAKKENLDYFKGRYQNTKLWLEKHPTYLKNYRAQKKSASKQKSRDIQVEITNNINNGKRQLQKLLLPDIQVE